MTPSTEYALAALIMGLAALGFAARRSVIFKLNREGLVFLWRVGTEDRQPLGLRIKLASQMLFSERKGGWKRAARIGPIYIRTYARLANLKAQTTNALAEGR